MRFLALFILLMCQHTFANTITCDNGMAFSSHGSAVYVGNEKLKPTRAAAAWGRLIYPGDSEGRVYKFISYSSDATTVIFIGRDRGQTAAPTAICSGLLY